MLSNNKYLKNTTAVYLLSFILATVAAAFAFALNGIYPGGEKSLLIMDMSDQYSSFFASLHGISDPNQLLYSWENAMGSGFLPLFTYYLSSPFSFLVLLFPRENMETSIYILTLLKIGLSAMTFCFFLNSRFGLAKFQHVAFSLCYSLMSYTMVYSMCLMWLDGVLWLPILIVGVDRIIDKQRLKLFLVTLTVMIFSNYYTAYMAFIFAFLYFMLRCIGELKLSIREILARLKLAIISTISAVGLTSFVTIPTLYALFGGRISYSLSPDGLTNFELIDLFDKFLPATYDSITNSGLPSIFVGITCLIFMICFVLNSDFPIRERISSLFLFGFLQASFYLVPLDIFWHAMKYPSWFPFRYAFVFGFFAVYIATKSYNSIENFFSIRTKKVVSIALIFIILGEMTYNASHMISGLNNQFAYDQADDFKDFHEELTPFIDEANSIAGEEFFRLEKDFERSKNDAASLSYNGITHYSSSFSDETNNMLYDLGLAQEYFWSSYYGASPLTDYLFSVRFLLIKGLPWGNYEAISSNGDITLYESKNTLPLVSSTTGNLPEFTDDKFANQESLLKFIQPYEGSVWEDVENLSYEVQDHAVHITFTTKIDGDVYANISPSTDFTVYVNDVELPKFVNYYQEGVNSFLGNFTANETINITLSCTNQPLIEPYILIKSFNSEKFTDVISNIPQAETEVGAREVDVILNSENSTYLFTSIPYDEGWKIFADGVELESEIFADALLTAKLPENTESVSLVFTPQGFAIGIGISALTIALLIFISVKFRKTI